MVTLKSNPVFVDRRVRAPLRRCCRRCDKMFVPTGKFNRLCVECIDEANVRSKPSRNAAIKKTIKRKASLDCYDW